MTRVMVRRRSEPVEAVQWHPGVEYEAARYDNIDRVWWNADTGRQLTDGDWIVQNRVLTPEQFAEEYERVDAALGRDA